MSNEKEPIFMGYKGVVIAVFIVIAFFGLFYLSMKTDPHYMPSQQPSSTQPSETNTHSQH